MSMRSGVEGAKSDPNAWQSGNPIGPLHPTHSAAMDRRKHSEEWRSSSNPSLASASDPAASSSPLTTSKTKRYMAAQVASRGNGSNLGKPDGLGRAKE